MKWKYDLSCGEYILDLNTKTLIKGILNVTPDSFSDGGNYDEMNAAVSHARAMVSNGADIIDIGGESTRHGFAKVWVGEKLGRVI
ncbi:dihydropteroate synthase, partial [Bacillus pseudomycoides]|nr:dihydropteroate synthase [Bacillus pseudomycoides]